MVFGSIGNNDALIILRRLRDAGFQAFFAGGCVRDLLLSQQPKDYDVATNAAPPQVRSLFKNTQAVGAAFGVILVREGRSTIEVATFRTDLEYKDGRRPEGVLFATPEQDAQRRDFTINGLFFDPIENRIIDYVGGQDDLKAKRLRAIGNAEERFAEDHLRLLRAVRFASRLQFEIEPATAAAIANHAQELIRISPERIAEELRKMLLPSSYNDAFRLLQKFGIIRILMRFLPEQSNAKNDGLLNLLALCGDGVSFSFGLVLAAIVLDFRMHASGQFDPRIWLNAIEIRRMVNAMRQTLKISNDESAEMSGALSWGQLLAESFTTVAVQKRFLQQPHSKAAMRLMAGIERAGLLQERICLLLNSLDELLQTDYAPVPLISGDDLTAAGATPGPGFKAALDRAYDAQLEGIITSAKQAMDLAMQEIKR